MKGLSDDTVLEPHRNIVVELGVEDYKTVLVLQRHLNQLRNDEQIGDCLILLQHEDVYTLGIHRNPSEILSGDIVPVEVERGGSATYHGPGQIVAYFIVNLKDHNINIRDLIESVESSISRVLREQGIVSEGKLYGETGVWVDEKKICSIGFAIKGFSTLHGIALNVSTDLSKFNHIMPCGMDSTVMTSVEGELGKKIGFENLKNRLREEFLSGIGIKEYLEIRSLKKMGSYSVSNGLRLLPEELLKIIV